MALAVMALSRCVGHLQAPERTTHQRSANGVVGHVEVYLKWSFSGADMV